MHSEVFPKLNESPNNGDIAETVLEARYYLPNESSWAHVVNRVSKFLSNDDERMIEFNRLLTQKKFIPNSPTLMNAGTSNPMMSACFVLPIEDDLESIMKTLRDAAFIFKSGGGVGINYSNLRPKGSKIGSTNGTASGTVSFMEMFNGMSETIKQGGKRRGAQISILDFTHPDLYEFITVKNTEGKLNNMNLSVMFKDMDIITILKHPETMHPCGKTYGELFDIIIDGIWRKGEPGCLFYDAINANVNGYKINATNPCGEMVLPDYGACCLGSFDVSKYYNPEKRNLNWKEFIHDIEYAAQMLNAINEKNKYPLPEIERVARYEHPRIGMGIMGYADLLLKFGYTYGNTNSKALLQDILGTMKTVAKRTIPGLESYLSIAPTGTISIFANASSGIEPVFSWVYMRRNTLGKEFLMVHPIFDQTIKKLIACETALTPEQKEAVYRAILDWAYRNGSIQKCPYIPDEIKRIYVCAMDITPDAHISIQAAAQREVDASISKTINLPSNATHKDIKKGVLDAWTSSCKGVTMYRDGSRTEVVLDLNREAKFQGEVKGKCPECGSELERSEGCIKCHSCGWSKCG